MSTTTGGKLVSSPEYKIGIVGAGQLARMMALAGIPMGFSFSFLCEASDDPSPVNHLGHLVQTDYSKLSAEEIYQLLGKPDVITVEKEDLDTELLKALTQFCPVHPNPDAVGVSQNRKSEKSFAESL